MIRAALLLILVFIALVPEPVRAHALDPGFLDLQSLGPTQWRVTWRKPQVQGRPMAIDAVLPESCDPRTGPDTVSDGRAFVAGWVVTCPAGLGGGDIRIEGLEATQTDVLVRYTLAPDAAVQAARLTAASPVLTVPPQQGGLARLASYFGFGLNHILEGIDHLLFVFALLLLIRRPRPLVGAITAFTVAHSLTLGAATLGWLVVPAPPVEAVIALSILILAAELLRPSGGKASLIERKPWTVCFAFGLLHGLGFAKALREIGLPESDVPLALLGFNLGVEAGQLLFVAAVLSAGMILSHLVRAGKPLLGRSTRGLTVAAYGIGTVAAFWMFERLSGFGA